MHLIHNRKTQILEYSIFLEAHFLENYQNLKVHKIEEFTCKTSYFRRFEHEMMEKPTKIVHLWTLFKPLQNPKDLE